MSKLATQLSLVLLCGTVSSCVVVPKKVASYDAKCHVSTQKIELTMEQMNTFDEIDCLTKSCRSELAWALLSSSLVVTTSAIVSGSVALIGNTLYWMESQGQCPNNIRLKDDTLQENIDEKYLIHEEIVAAKS